MSSTHDWSVTVDTDHLLAIQRDVKQFTKGGVMHLVLEVIAYAVDEVIEGTTDQIRVTLHKDGSVCVADNGRGTAVREMSDMPMVKPIMTTPDLRFFGISDAPHLPDGLVRSGISVVAALSEWMIHTNRRSNGSWTQRYEHGLPCSPLTAISGNGTTGTTVCFCPDVAVFGHDKVSAPVLSNLCTKYDGVVDFVIQEEQAV